MQFKMSRQLVTGLIVNTKVNIRPEYYRWTRAMCHKLFETGEYQRPPDKIHPGRQPIESLGPIEGMLSHIHHVKDSIDDPEEKEKGGKPTAAHKLYARFLKYKYFVRLERPLIVCEGKTDNIYLKSAIPRLPEFHPKLGSWNGTTFTSAVAFFSYDNQACRLVNLEGGTGDLVYFFLHGHRGKKKPGYRGDIRSFKHRPLQHPVIVLIDNDDGAKNIFSAFRQTYKISVCQKSSESFYHVTDNLYLVKTPEQGACGESRIEDFFEPWVQRIEIKGKKFNPRGENLSSDEYGKFVFATEVVKRNASKIDFSKFTSILNRITAVIDDYSTRRLQQNSS